jgi:hypothetical protein
VRILGSVVLAQTRLAKKNEVGQKQTFFSRIDA